MASISSLICRFLSRFARFPSSGELRLRLLDLDDDPKETRDEAADDEVEHAEEDVEKGLVRRASDAFNCFLFNINLEDGDKVGEIGAEDEACMSFGLITSSMAVVSLTGSVTALEPVLRGLSDFRRRYTAAEEGPTRIPPPPSVPACAPPTLLLALLLVDSLASAPLM